MKHHEVVGILRWAMPWTVAEYWEVWLIGFAFFPGSKHHQKSRTYSMITLLVGIGVKLYIKGNGERRTWSNVVSSTILSEGMWSLPQSWRIMVLPPSYPGWFLPPTPPEGTWFLPHSGPFHYPEEIWSLPPSHPEGTYSGLPSHCTSSEWHGQRALKLAGCHWFKVIRLSYISTSHLILKR